MQTIFALSTPPGKSGVAIIRVSGSLANAALQVFGISKKIEPRMATLAPLKHGGELIDHALLLSFQAPHSFTGEDVLELHCHGGRAVVRQILTILSSLEGYRLAEPGEFSRRAFANGKMDLTAVEGLADLIDADTEAQRKQALRMIQEAAAFYGNLRKCVLHALAFLEAYIDFPDEDIPDEVLSQIEDELRDIKTLVESQLKDNGANEKIREGFHIAILGAPNVGKSSLMNMLAGRDVAIVSHLAGTTRDVIEVQMDIKGYSVILADTAGIREQAGEIEQEGIRRSLARAEQADVKIVVLDANEINLKGGEHSSPPLCSPSEGVVVKNSSAYPREIPLSTLVDENTIILMNKVDIASPSLGTINGIVPIAFSVKAKKGMEQLIDAIYEKISDMIPPEAMFVTRARHRKHLEEALMHIEQYQSKKELGLELRCEELRRAATEVGRITGIITADEVLGEIFGSFCIGK